MADVPEELIEDIFSRLPVKSLFRFKTASKNWYSLISKDYKFHMKQSLSASKSLIFYQMPANGDGVVFRYSDVNSYESRQIIFPVEIVRFQPIGSANGLICLGPSYRGNWGGCFIWNPCTGECKSISLHFPGAVDSSSTPFKFGYSRLFGFGYDSISDDYKILGDCGSRIGIFSLKSNSCKILDFAVECPSIVCASYSNGALHWCTVSPNISPLVTSITAFDLANEKIFFLELPEKLKCMNLRYIWLQLFDYRGLLCTCDRESIWVMQEYGNTKSWAKFTTPLPEDVRAIPKGISRLGEVVYLTKSGIGCVKSNIQGRISDADKSRLLDFGDAFAYNESLISPKCFDPK